MSASMIAMIVASWVGIGLLGSHIVRQHWRWHGWRWHNGYRVSGLVLSLAGPVNVLAAGVMIGVCRLSGGQPASKGGTDGTE